MSVRTDGWRVVSLAAFAAGAATLLVASTVSAQSASSATQVTYTKDIAPILQRSCENCHRAGWRRPDVAHDYEEVRPWARAIKQRTGIGPHAGVMPPWYMEKNIGIQSFKNDPSLSDEGDRQDRQMGGHRRPARQPRRHAAAPEVGRREYMGDWQTGSRL